MEPTVFVACSGATTTEVLFGNPDIGNWNEGPQVDALSQEETEIVTISIGSNDVGFADYAKACVLNSHIPNLGCGPGTPAYADISSKINANSFLPKLEAVYNTILQKAPNAQVYVLSYPMLFGDAASSVNCTFADATGAE